ncbi:helix-turn-helix domain-containing protein [Granulicella arctica]|uniref:AraC family ethanolamine operon transcriptional activator n=1 Tax=Granulicella arctica TaxID=940613 RepID=A0A7Y9PHK5_9BACT|nr:helix-turn-helix domain-containing protein [Granulicella arctica]NYF80030.1 AraC family ethanolamine operon transcriptional activator [Granulicella arctica]
MKRPHNGIYIVTEPFHHVLPSRSSISTGATASQGLYAEHATDADDHATNLRGWSQLYDQLAPGPFTGAINGLQLDSMHLFHESTSQTLRQSCVVHSDSWWFGFPLSDADEFRVGRSPVGEGCIAIRPGRAHFELLTPRDFHILGIVISRKDLEDHLRILNQTETNLRLFGSETLKIGTAALNKLRFLVCELLQEISSAPKLLQHAASRESMRISVLDALTGICSEGEENHRLKASQLSHYAMVRNVRQYLLEDPYRATSVPELCKVFGASRRTLQYAFQDVLGMAPNAYLRTLRLNGVRRALRDAKPGAASIQQVAADWGFWHLSQFARDYRSLFGELPSERLKRSSSIVNPR